MTYLESLDVSHLEFQDGRQQKSLFCPYIFELIHAMILFLCLFLEMLFLFQNLLFGKIRVFCGCQSHFVHQSNEVNEVIVLCFKKIKK